MKKIFLLTIVLSVSIFCSGQNNLPKVKTGCKLLSGKQLVEIILSTNPLKAIQDLGGHTVKNDVNYYALCDCETPGYYCEGTRITNGSLDYYETWDRDNYKAIWDFVRDNYSLYGTSTFETNSCGIQYYYTVGDYFIGFCSYIQPNLKTSDLEIRRIVISRSKPSGLDHPKDPWKK